MKKVQVSRSSGLGVSINFLREVVCGGEGVNVNYPSNTGPSSSNNKKCPSCNQQQFKSLSKVHIHVPPRLLLSSSSTSEIIKTKLPTSLFSSSQCANIGRTRPTSLYSHNRHTFTNTQSQSFSTKSKSSSISSSCPFKTLSIPKTSTYSHAKKSFLKIAMKNHPDTIHQHLSKDDQHYDAKMKASIELFRQARVAFESLVEGDEGECLLKVEVEVKQELSNEQFEYVVYLFFFIVCYFKKIQRLDFSQCLETIHDFLYVFLSFYLYHLFYVVK